MSSDPNRPRPRSSKKQRARQGGAARPTATQRATAGPTQGGRASGGIPTVWLAVITVVVFAIGVALAGGAIQFGGGGGNPSARTDPSNGESPGASVGARGENCPTAQPPAAAAGTTSVVTMATELGEIQITLDADLSPIAVGNFAALVGCGYYDGIVFHRVVPNFVIQGGDPTGTGTGGPGYTIKDEPVTTTYSRGTVAMARSSGKDTVGSQFFIVLSDEARTALADPKYNNYQIIGMVTSGMETADAITAAAAGRESPADPVTMTAVTIAPAQPRPSSSPAPSAAASIAPSASTTP